MISLFYTEKLLTSVPGTDLIKKKCAVKKLVLHSVADSSGTVLFRDGSLAGAIKARLTVTDGSNQAELVCTDSEIINFSVGVFVEVSSSGPVAVGAYTMGNPDSGLNG